LQGSRCAKTKFFVCKGFFADLGGPSAMTQNVQNHHVFGRGHYEFLIAIREFYEPHPWASVTLEMAKS
jgi:hypothetical protein